MSHVAEAWLAIREDARFAYQSLVRVPTYTATVILTFALAIGGVTAVFSVLYAVALRPLPFPSPGDLMAVQGHFVGFDRVSLSPNEYLDIRNQNHSFSKVAAFTPGSVNLTGHGSAVRIPSGWVTTDFFGALGVAPALGRDFAPGEDHLGAPKVALVSSSFHRRVLGSVPDVVGKTIEIDGEPHTIVGVLPPVIDRERRIIDLKSDGNETCDVWIPLAFTREQLDPRTRSQRYLAVIGRLRADGSKSSAAADMSRLTASFYEAYPREYERATGWSISVNALQDASGRDTAFALSLLLGAVALLLLAACANVVSITLARLAGRKREIAVRAALGATAGRIAVQFLVESVLLALAGGALGVVVGRLGMDGLLEAASESSIIHRTEVALRLPVLGFAILTSVLAGLLAGTAPAWHAARLSPSVGMREGGRATSESAHRLRSTLVVAQVVVALVLLVGAGMLLRSIVALTTASPGFAPADVYVGSVSLAEPRYTAEPDQRRFAAGALQGIRAIAGVEAAGLTNLLPLSGFSNWSFRIEGDPSAPVPPSAQLRTVLGDYFAALGIRVVAGRALGPGDTNEAPGAAVINQTLAHRYFAGRDPIGRRVLFTRTPGSSSEDDPRTFTIVGVVADTRDMGVDRPVPPFLYASYDQWPKGSIGLVIRAPAIGPAALSAMQSAIAAVDPAQPLYDPQPLQRLVDESLGSRRFILILLGVFAALGLALAALGIYGIASYSVTQRTQELAVRMAMGADPSAIARLVLAQTVRLVAIGLIIGVVIASLLGRLLASTLYGLSLWDPQALAVLAALFVTTAVAAGWGPANRAARVPLAAALRSE